MDWYCFRKEPTSQERFINVHLLWRFQNHRLWYGFSLSVVISTALKLSTLKIEQNNFIFNLNYFNSNNALNQIRGCLHVKFDPGMKLVPGWSHPCLWWNVSYCLHVFAEINFIPGWKTGMKFHPGMKKEKKRCKHLIPGWNFKMS